MWRFVRFACTAAAVSAVCLSDAALAQGVSSLGGVWTLNRSLSEMPPQIGFDVTGSPPSGAADRSGRPGGGGRGRRDSVGQLSMPRESYEDAQRLRLLTAEARNPPARLMIVDTPASVTMTNEVGQSRVLHPTGREESIDVQNVPIPVTSRRDGDRLMVTYRVEQGREIRYTYSRSADPSQLVVEVQFLERGAGDKARRVYQPGVETEAAPVSAAPTMPATTRPSEAFDPRPGAELKGLKSLGILVEDLSGQAVSCGLNRDVLEAALSQRLADAGFTVRKNSDDDTYVYVNVMTNTVADGTCVSRYDAFLYTHATANLSYRDQPVLVQVSLMHRGGIGNSARPSHAAAVGRALQEYIDLFIAQIRDANK